MTISCYPGELLHDNIISKLKLLILLNMITPFFCEFSSLLSDLFVQGGFLLEGVKSK